MKIKPWAIVTAGVGGLYFAFPLLAVFLFSLRGAKGHLGFSAYVRVFRDPLFAKSFLFSAGISVAVMALGLALVVPAAIAARKSLRGLRPVMDALSNLPFTVPAIVLAYGLIKLYSRPPFVLTSSVFLLVAGNVVICLPYLYRSIDAGLSAIDIKALSEAAASLGASGIRTTIRVILPNITAAMLGSSSIVFAMVMGELTLAVMLAWPAFGPYMALVGRDLAYEPAALAVLSFFLTWISVALFRAIMNAFGERQRDPS